MAEARRERKVVTILFADLVGFTSRAEQMDPEDVAAELGRYQGQLRTDLERHGGTVEKFIGDAVMAVFGAPVAHEDDPERGVRAALAIVNWAGEAGVEMRIGVNTGEALVTLGARPEAGETMVAGDVVNTAARLQAAAPVNGVLVGEQTFRATERAIEFRPVDPVDAKGKSQPVSAWQAVQAKARIGVDRVHGAALVGRVREVALLEDALERTLAERSPQLLTLVGVPGIGKSRLVLELFGALERRPDLISWRQGRCLPYGDGVTFWALGEMVKAQAGILEGDDVAETERKLGEAVSDPWVASHLRPLVGLAAAASSSGGDAREEAFTAWRRFFEDLAGERPLILVFEDIHWADDNLLDFVDHLVDWAGAVPLLVLCTARPELLTRRAGWGGGKPNALTVSLSPLGDDDTARLLQELVGTLLPAETQSELLARAGGNPLYAEEFARMLRDRGVQGELPETVQGLIAARLDLLDPREKALLRDAAVIGKRFWLGAAATLSGLEGHTLATVLHELERREFLRRERESSVVDEVEYGFRHLLVRDVAYGQIPRAERAEKHLLAAGWIEQLGRREDHAEMLAHHYLQAVELTRAAGGDIDRFAEAARSALADAGDRAFALHAFRVAARFFRVSLELREEPDPTLLLRLGHALYLSGEHDAAVLERARDALLAAGDVEGAVEAEVIQCELHWLDGDRDRAREHLDGATRLAEPLPASEAKARATSTASRIMMLAGEHGEAIRVGEEALAMAEQLGLDEIRAATLDNVGAARAALGDERGLAEIEAAIELAGGANAHFETVRAMGNLAAQYWILGRLEEAYRLWIDAGDEARRYGQTGFARWFDGVVIGPEAEFGKWDEALARTDAFLEKVEAGSPHYLASQSYGTRAMIRLGRGDANGAVHDVEVGLALGARAKDPQIVFQLYAVAAHVYRHTGDEARASSLSGDFLAALTGGRDMGFALGSAHIHSWTLAAAGRGAELAAALAGQERSPFVLAAKTFARGDPLGAADICEGIGAASQEAFARLVAAEGLVAQGRRAEADAQLQRALAFYRSAGASWYVRRGEALLAASA